jgi:hypothetical protein
VSGTSGISLFGFLFVNKLLIQANNKRTPSHATTIAVIGIRPDRCAAHTAHSTFKAAASFPNERERRMHANAHATHCTVVTVRLWASQ